MFARKFSSLPRKHHRTSRGTLHKGISRLQPDDFVNTLCNMFNKNLSEVPNFIRISLSSMKKSNLKIFHQFLCDILDDNPSICLFKQYFRQALDFIESKLYKPLPNRAKKKPPENLCSIYFDNKGVELINIPRILQHPDITSSLPTTTIKFPIPRVTYKLAPHLLTRIFNFNHFVNNLDLDNFLHDPTSLPCTCDKSPFVDKHHKHLVTGDLRIIKNNTLRKFFGKGPKYRTPQPIDFIKAKSCILNGLETCVKNWCSKNGINKSFFAEWIITIKGKINDRIIAINNNFQQYKCFDTLSSPDVKQALDDIHQNYIVVPIDKATNNVALVCKRFYASVIVEELGLVNKLHSLQGKLIKTNHKKINKNQLKENQ